MQQQVLIEGLPSGSSAQGGDPQLTNQPANQSTAALVWGKFNLLETQAHPGE